ncbi:lipase 1 [Manduca sexta]|uniref:lipase 1 n=1 Tax=Manduca sexta TaxID=7130 RepID=UPI00188F25F7|nr:lipase 1 [Manduca sexta]
MLLLLTLLITLDTVLPLSMDTITATLTNLPEESRYNFTQLANKYSLQAREYDILTEDGYILTLFNIPGDKTRPVLLGHGIFGTSDIFLTRGNTSFAYILAGEGYDVWALNVRGTKYSRRHVTLDPDKDKAFWNFSIQEHGFYDLASNIDFILEKTGQKSLSIVGISEGTTITFILASTKPEYNEKIRVFIALAPVVYLQNLSPPSSTVMQFSTEINYLLEAIGQEEVFGYKSIYKAIYNIICAQKIGYDLCLRFGVFPVTGADSAELEPEFFIASLGQFPDGTSRKNLAHYAQIGKNKRFAQYDYGREKNLEKYNSDLPPLYNLTKATLDTALICGKNDKISTLGDVEILRRQIPNLISYRVMEPEFFNHLDHVWGKNVHKISYPFILKLLSKYN